jgi:S1-C subfamily serine protease
MMSRRILSIIVLTSIVLTCIAAPAMAAEEGWQAASKSTVAVMYTIPTGASGAGGDWVGGSGEVVGEGYVITNAHVIAGYLGQKQDLLARLGFEVELFVYDGESNRPAKIIAISQAADLALLRVPGLTAPPLAWGDSANVKTGQQVYALGYPQNVRKVSVTKGTPPRSAAATAAAPWSTPKAGTSA